MLPAGKRGLDEAAAAVRERGNVRHFGVAECKVENRRVLGQPLDFAGARNDDDVAGLSRAVIGTFFDLAGVMVVLTCAPLGGIIIRVAGSAPSHRSRLHAVVGWLLGFFVIDAAILVGIGVAILVPLLVK